MTAWGVLQIEQKEKDAVIRMMIYIKYELKRLKMDHEAVFVDNAISLAENRTPKRDNSD